MRKYQRAILRARAEKKKTKPNKYVHDQWTKYQLSFRDPHVVALNQAHGSKKRKVRKNVA